MRPLGAVLVAILVIIVLLSSVGARAQVTDPGDPAYVNRILVDFITPTIAPGQIANFSLEVNNSYSWSVRDAVMTDVTVTASIYEYATQEESRLVNDSFSHPPLIDGESLEKVRVIPTIGAKGSVRVYFDIETTHQTPHGTYFSPSSYFIRFMVSFEFAGNATPVVLKSRGYFTDEQWNRMVSIENGRSVLDVDYMHSLGVDGIIPDSSFGLKLPIPKWPLAALILVCFAVSVMVTYYFVLDNPGKFPRLEKRFYYLRGKLSESRRKLKDRRGK